MPNYVNTSWLKMKSEPKPTQEEEKKLDNKELQELLRRESLELQLFNETMDPIEKSRLMYSDKHLRNNGKKI